MNTLKTLLKTTPRVSALSLLFAALFSAQAQNTISGTFSPTEDYTWLIAYQLKPGTQQYVADTKITNGTFELKLPESSISGTYRLVYAIPQEEYYFDVLYTGEEAIELAFDAEAGVTFSASQENRLLTEYFKKINRLERALIKYYTAGSDDVKTYKSILKDLSETQQAYEASSEKHLAGNFIRANRPYIPAKVESLQEYVAGKKGAYFDALDFSNPTLQASAFLTDKLTNYVFTALPLEPMDQAATENAIQHNVKEVSSRLNALRPKYKVHLYYTLWTQAAASSFDTTSDFIFNSYLKELAKTTGDLEIIQQIELHNRLRLGAKAPDIVWKAADSLKSLSGLDARSNHVLVFWSSTCSHCLNELPKFHTALKAHEDVSVLAVGLEEDDGYWKQEVARLPEFEHAISLGKWESEYAQLYAIQQTPTYFVLDKEKRIVAKPEDYHAVLEFLEQQGQ